MGIDPVTMMIASKVVSGFMEYREQRAADKEERRAYERSVAVARQQAQLNADDAERAALEEERAAEKHRMLQKVMFMKSGVDLTGSPLLVMEATRNKGRENAKNVVDRANAQNNLAIQSAVANVPTPRANLFGTIAKTAAGVAGSYTQSQLMKRQLQPSETWANGDAFR